MMDRSKRAGFTLVEVLAAMTVLMIIVLMLGRIFRDSTNAWTVGTRQMEDNLNGRAVLDFIARDISQAMIRGTGLCFRLRSSVTRTYAPQVWNSDELYFVSFSGNPSDSANGFREVREIVYYVTNMHKTVSGNPIPIPGRYCLKRAMRSTRDELTCYDNAYWWKDITKQYDDPVIAENISKFVVWCAGATNRPDGRADYWHGIHDYNNAADLALMTYPAYYDRTKVLPYIRGKLPVRADLYIEMLGEDAAAKAAQLYNAGLTDQGYVHIDRNIRKYMTRVYFINRSGSPMGE